MWKLWRKRTWHEFLSFSPKPKFLSGAGKTCMEVHAQSLITKPSDQNEQNCKQCTEDTVNINFESMDGYETENDHTDDHTDDHNFSGFYIDEEEPDSDNEESNNDIEDPIEDEVVLVTEASRDLAAFKAYVHKKPQVIIADSAAAVSIVSLDFWEDYNSACGKKNVLRKYKGPAIRVGDARAQRIEGIASIFFYIGKHKFKVDALVIKDWIHDFLLSIQWLREHKAVIDPMMLCIFQQQKK
jgi:hypothetical protein